MKENWWGDTIGENENPMPIKLKDTSVKKLKARLLSEVVLKTCKICKEEKPEEDFYFYTYYKDKRMAACKRCHISRQKRIYQSRKGYYQAKAKAWYAQNKDRCRANRRRFIEANPNYQKEYYKKWYERKKNERSGKV